MKNVILIPSNTDLNRGDQALVWESLRLIDDVYGKGKVCCKLMADLSDRDLNLQTNQTRRLGLSFVDSLLKHPGRRFLNKKKDSNSYSKSTILGWGIQATIDYLHTFLLLSKIHLLRKLGELLLSEKERTTLAEIKNADAIFVKGGGFIHSYGAITDAYFVYFLTFHIRLAAAYGKNVYMLPNSIGPLKNKVAKRIAIKALKDCKLITVRESISQELLGSIGVTSKLYPDLGFYLSPSETDMGGYLQSHGVPLNQKKVIMTLRPYRFQGHNNPEKLYKEYINGFVILVNELVGQGYHVTFMAHTLGPSSHEDDRLAIRSVLAALTSEVRQLTSYIEDVNLTCKDVEKIYSYYDYMVGTRFHSVIFSLNVGVPSIAIAYGGNKGKGIMRVLGNNDFSIDMDKVRNDELVTVFQKLESERINYLMNLTGKRKIINVQRETLIGEIRALL